MRNGPILVAAAQFVDFVLRGLGWQALQKTRDHIIVVAGFQTDEGLDPRVSHWLNDLAEKVRTYSNEPNNMSRNQVVEMIAREIEQSVPLVPIPLTDEGDVLREYSPINETHTRDQDNLVCNVGTHKYCNGPMDRRGATKAQDCIVCRECHLRVLFPKEITTYGQLRRFLANKLSQTNLI